jgi:hypothetical protein
MYVKNTPVSSSYCTKSTCNYPSKDSIIILVGIVNMIREGTTISHDDDSFERLRCLLEQLRGVPVSYEAAREFGDTLIDFYELLADTSQGQL